MEKGWTREEPAPFVKGSSDKVFHTMLVNGGNTREWGGSEITRQN